MSPAFYPSPLTFEHYPSKWSSAIRKAQDFIALHNLTVEEKVALTTGVGWQNGRCVGNIAEIKRIGWKGLCLQDAPMGVRFADFVSALYVQYELRDITHDVHVAPLDITLRLRMLCEILQTLIYRLSQL